MEEFLSLTGYGVSAKDERHPALAVHRKRHRRSRILGSDVQVQEKYFKVWATGNSDNGKDDVPAGPKHLREMIVTAVTSMFGESANAQRFKWDLVSFNEKTKVGRLRVETTDFVAFQAALALLPLEEGRIHLEPEFGS